MESISLCTVVVASELPGSILGWLRVDGVMRLSLAWEFSGLCRFLWSEVFAAADYIRNCILCAILAQIGHFPRPRNCKHAYSEGYIR